MNEILNPYFFIDNSFEIFSALTYQDTIKFPASAIYHSTNTISQTVKSNSVLSGAGIKFSSRDNVFIAFEASLGFNYFLQKGKLSNTVNYYNTKTASGYYLARPEVILPSKGIIFTGNTVRITIGILL